MHRPVNEIATDPVVSPHTIEHVFGLRRSGNHIVIKWLQSCYEAMGETTIHENDVYADYLAPEFQGHDSSPETVWHRSEGHGVLIASYEDVDFDSRQASPVYSELQPPEFGQSARDTIVIRDWFNMTASRLTYQEKHDELASKNSLGRIFGLEWPELEDRWLQYAGIVLGEAAHSDGPIGVNYNRWFAEPEYREQLARQYGVPNSDEALDIVPPNGSGSSFDRKAMHGLGTSMNVLKRWENLDPELLERYRSLISNPVLGEINYKLFGIDQERVLASVS